ncbi:MAG: hypothetical protein WC657_08830 [Candidatus Paceibacterota bacterium]
MEKNFFVNLETSRIVGYYFIYLLKLVLSYISYSFLTVVIISCFVSLVFSAINFNGNDFSFLISHRAEAISNLLGMSGDGNFVASDVLLVFGRMSLIVSVIGVVVRKIITKIKGPKFVLKSPFHLFSYALITFIFILNPISALSPLAADGAESVIPVMAFFWVIALVNNAMSIFVDSIANKIKPQTLIKFIN